MVSLLDLSEICLIDLSLAGDNALVVGMAASLLPAKKRKQAMWIGLGSATLLRILMALFAVQLLQFTGLLVAGGLLLLWVGWKMLRDLHILKTATPSAMPQAQKTSIAIWRILVADVSMSLDNILGVAGVARERQAELVIGLVLSVALMGFASSQIARLTERYPKLGYIGVVIILYTALHMIYDGAGELLHPIHGYA